MFLIPTFIFIIKSVVTKFTYFKILIRLYIINTQLTFQTKKFAKLLLSSPKYFYTFEKYKNLMYNVFLCVYVYI
jgi:hypothetical protein